MRGVLVELSRLRRRRAVVGLLVAMLAITAVVLGGTVYETRPVTGAEADRAEQRFQREAEAAAGEIARCREDPESYFGPGAAELDCEGLAPQPEWFSPRPVLDVAEQARSTGPGLGLLVSALTILLGATFAGADWSSGSMTNQLLFRPRRARLWLAKAVAVTVASALAAVTVLALYWAGILAVAGARDLPFPDAVGREILTGTARAVALAAAAGLGGYALTMWLRRTGGTIGAMFGFAVVSEVLVATLPIEKMSQWSLFNNLAAWLSKDTEVYDDSLCASTGGGFGDVGGCDPTYVLTWEHGAVYLAVLLLLAVLVSLLSFTRRDVG